jgi:hypothetical protein
MRCASLLRERAGVIVRAMGLRRHLLALVLFHAVSACGIAMAAPPASGDRAVVAVSRTAAPADDGAAAGEGIACQTDADCPHLACGPCEAGTPITRDMLGGPSCAVNPCLDASAVCSAQHRCEIGPRTRKNPAVWKRPPG